MISKRTSRSYVTHAESAPAYWMIGVLWRVLATGVQTGNAMCLLDQFCSKGAGPTRHTHPQDEGLYVARGAVTFNAGGAELVAGAGSLVTVPRHTEHSFLVDEEAVLINFYFPAGFDLWLMGSAVPAQRNELPPPDAPMPPYRLMKQLSDDYAGMPMTEERTTSPNPNALAVPTLTSQRTAESMWYDQSRWSILADGASTGSSYCVFEVETPHDAGEELHIHDHTDKAYYVLDGALDIFVDDQVHSLSKGSFIFVPRSSVHAFRVTSEAARYLQIHTMPGYERVLRAFGTPASVPGLPPAGTLQESCPPERLKEVHSEIGLRPIVVPSDLRAGANR